MKQQFGWTAQVEGKKLLVTYSFRNDEGRKIFICQPDPPYVEVGRDGRVKIWLGVYVLGPKDLVEAPEVPPVVELDQGSVMHGRFELALPLDEIHPFPRHERDEKLLGTTSEVSLEVGYFPHDAAHLPPSVEMGGKTVQVAPYDWAAKTLQYVKFAPKTIEVPVKVPRKLAGGAQR